MFNNIDPEILYRRLGQLIQNMPDFVSRGMTEDKHKWLGDAYALVETSGDLIDMAKLKLEIGMLIDSAEFSEKLENVDDEELDDFYNNQRSRLSKIKTILYRALSIAELKSPTAVHGSFINAGDGSSAFMAISQVFVNAKSKILIVDPYLDKKIFTKYMSAISDGVNIKLLASKKNNNIGALSQDFEDWVKKNNSTRPTELRIAGKNVLHDRLVIIDNNEIYILTQSFNIFAEKSPASIVRFQGIDLKLEAYKDIWKDAENITP